MIKNKIRVFVASALLSAVPLIAAAADGIQSPLSVTSIADFIAKTLEVMVTIALPIVGLFMLLAGFQFLTAQGNSDRLTKARTNFMYVIIGAALMLGAWVLAKLIGNTVTTIVGPSVGL